MKKENLATLDIKKHIFYEMYYPRLKIKNADVETPALLIALIKWCALALVDLGLNTHFDHYH